MATRQIDRDSLDLLIAYDPIHRFYEALAVEPEVDWIPLPLGFLRELGP